MFKNGILRYESKNGNVNFFLWGFILLDKEEGTKLFYGEPVYTSFGIFQ